MERKNFGHMQCPIARSLEHVGDWGSILILRDALYGVTRFDEFQKSLGIAPNMLTRRLKGMVESGVMERRQYSERPPRFEYVLTEMGNDFRPIVLSLMTWGNKHFAPEGVSVLLKNVETGEIAVPILTDKVSGREIEAGLFKVVAGPAADEDMRKRITSAKIDVL
jgi:DNA-binding HxlR family transcriptional regulator